MSTKTRDETARPRLFMSVIDISEECGISVTTVWRWTAAGLLPAPLRIGKVVRWRRQDVLDWAERGCPAVAQGGGR